DRYFIDRLASEIWDIQDGALKRYEGGWTAFEKARDEGRPLPDPETPTGALGRPADASPARGSPRPSPRAATRPGGRSPAPPRDAAGRLDDRPGRRSTSSRVRKVEGVRALEARIAAMELQLSQLAKKLEDIARSGDFMETRRLGSEHAELERALKQLYDEWSASVEPQEGP